MLGAGAAALVVAALPALAATIPVSVVDNAFSPPVATAAQGDTVEWTWNGFASHTVTDGTGMGLFDSGPRSLGAKFSFAFDSAGKYEYVCVLHFGMAGTVEVPTVVTPETGNRQTAFTVRTASADAVAGFVFDVQIKRPRTKKKKFVDWRINQTSRTLQFVPDDGTGKYVFRSRLRKTSNGEASKYSPKDSIVVS